MARNVIEYRININDNPEGHYDKHICIPLIIGANQGQYNATEVEILNKFSKVSKDQTIIVCNNGNPIPWAQRITEILNKHGWQSIPEPSKEKSNYLKIFPDGRRPFIMIPVQQFNHDIDEIFRIYDQDKIKKEMLSDIEGHYHRGAMIWTQVTSFTKIENSANQNLMSAMQSFLKKICPWLNEILCRSSIQIPNLLNHLTFRLIEYRSYPGINDHLQDHIDASIFTCILYQDKPTLVVREFLDDSFNHGTTQEIDVSTDLTAGNAVLFTGYLCNDKLQTDTPACWHKAQLPDDVVRRRSLVLRVEGSPHNYG
jgi:hypothetical protein